MKKIFFIVGTILLIGGLVWYFFFQSKNIANAPEEAQDGNSKKDFAENGWIEVENRGVYLVNTDGTLGTELQQGDEIMTGQTLMTDKTGLASLHFFDGSTLSMESETKISLDNFNYFSNDKSLKVKISLQAGRVWSRIKALVTPESYWEVETTNAVAAVRGTSFGVSYISGQTTIIGSVHLININAKDPQTQEMIKDNTAYIGENQYIIINDQEIKGLVTGVKLTSKVRTYSAKIKNDPWVIKSKEADKVSEEQMTTSTRPESSGELLTRPLTEEEKLSTSTTNENPVQNNEQPASGSGGGSSSYNPDEPVSSDNLTEENDPTHGTIVDDSTVVPENEEPNPTGANIDPTHGTIITSSTDTSTSSNLNLLNNNILLKTTTTTPTTTLTPTTRLYIR